MKPTLSDKDIHKHTAALEKKLVPFNIRFPGSAGERQPVHTVYGGAHLFKFNTTRKLGETAQRFLKEYGRDPVTFAGVSVALLLIALAACVAPAVRAIRVDPLIALRTE